MAREFKLLFLLLFIVACEATDSDAVPTTSPPPTTTGSDAVPTTSSPPTTTGSDAVPTTSSPPTTTGSDAVPTTSSPTTTTGSGGGNATSSPTTTTGSDGGNATSSPAPTTGSGGGNATSSSATTTGSGGPATTTPLPATTKPLDPCDSNPCGRGSTCEPRANQKFVCLCLAGDYYNNISRACESAKVFPGQLNLKMAYDKDMAVKTSTVFQTESKKITDALNKIYEDSDGYAESIVLELRPSTESKFWSRSGESVTASVEIIFETNADITSSAIKEQIKEASDSPDSLLGEFTETDLCEKDTTCDKETAKCTSKNGLFNCTCNGNYIPTDFSNRMCLACPSGMKASGSVCIECPFGYSGLNCNESWQLTLVIVGSVLGGLLLITLILLPVVACKSSKKSSSKNKVVDIGEPYTSHSPAKAPLVNSSLANSRAPSVNNGPANGVGSFANAGAPRIPRATTTSSLDRRTHLEMTPSSSQQNLISAGRNTQLYEDVDDMNSNTYTQARPPSSLYAQARPPSSLYAQDRPHSNPYAQDRPQSSPYAQARPQNNPYAQNRPQTNPYASSQGQTNPYYMHDNGRFN